MSDANNQDSIMPDRSKPLPRPPKAKPKKEQPIVQPKNLEQLSAEKSIEFIFDQTRDIGLAQPYHLDGDPAMYTPENIAKRNGLFDDPDIVKELDKLVALYKFSADGSLSFKEYSLVHERLAGILRPQMDKEELKETVQADYQYDSEGGRLTPPLLRQKLFEMVDVWTTSAERLEYLCFLRLLRVKLERLLKLPL